jgi:acyl dehydratase
MGGEGIEVRLPSRMGINYGLNRVRFINPVHIGKRIRTRSRLLSVEEVQPNVIQQVTELTVEIEGEPKPAMVAESLTRLYL